MRFSFLILLTTVGLVGCGGDDTTTMTGADLSVASDMAVAQASCATYCTTVLANCSGAPMSADGGAVGLAPFSGMTACMNACARWPAGKIGDTSGDSVACRAYHAMAAGGGMGAARTHCPHASLSGGGVCGADRCANFCELATQLCTAANGVSDPQFGSKADCLAQCGKAPFAFDANEPELVVDTPTLNCAFYHLGEAFASPMATGGSAADHCGDFRASNVDRGCQ